MIDNLYDIRDFLRDNLMIVLPVAMIFFLLSGFAIFTVRTIIPQWRTRNELATQVVSAQEALIQNEAGQDAVTQFLDQQIKDSQAEVEAMTAVFMTETRAGLILNNLYRYAETADVDLIDLQAQTGTLTGNETGQAGGQKSVYDARIFRIRAAGPIPNLLDFISQIREASDPNFAIDGVVIRAEEMPATGAILTIMTLDFTLYTSPYATDNPPEDESETSTSGDFVSIPTSLPPGAANDQEMLRTALDDAWTAEDWPQVIVLLGDLQELAPDDIELGEKEYAARVNYGYDLLAASQFDAAIDQFGAALIRNPDRMEAVAGQNQAILALLSPQLDGLWNSQNWPETIQLIEQILAADPVNEGMRAKLYAAHVNYGYQLLEQQQVEQARSQFELALEINPDGGEASLGLQSIPGGGGTIYIVLPGDTLFTIAQRFGTTVAAIQAANGLIGTRIDANQSLIIP